MKLNSFVIHKMTTRFGTGVSHDVEASRLVHESPEAGVYSPVYCITSRDRQGVAILVDDKGTLLQVMIISPADGDGAHQLHNLETGLYMSAIPTSPMGLIEINRDIGSEWERFWLNSQRENVDQIAHYQSILNVFFLSAADISARAYLLMRRLAEQKTANVIKAIVADFTFHDIQPVASEITRDPLLANHLAELFGDDPWVSRAIPDLLKWARQDPANRARSHFLGPELDHIIAAGVQGPYSFPLALNFSLRNRITPHKSACIIATARNEGVYLVDWLAHHRAIGFDGFLIYTNNNDDGSDELLQCLASAGEIELVNNVVGESTGPQGKAYAHALQMLPSVLDYQWSAIIDLDEYININPIKYRDMNHFLDRHALLGSDSIGLNWTINFPNRASRWTDEPVEERFPLSRVDVHIKSIFRPHRFVNSHSHYPYDVFSSPRSYNYAGREPARAYPYNEQPNCEDAWVSHYYYKSIEEFFERRTRRQADVPLDLKTDYARITDEAISSYLDAYFQNDNGPGSPGYTKVLGVSAQRERILSLEGVRAALVNVKAIYGKRLSHVRTTIAEGERYNQPATPPFRIRELMQSGPNG